MADHPHPVDVLQAALDGRLEPEARRELDRHLATCQPCRQEMEALRWTRNKVRDVASAGDAGVPADFKDRLRRMLDDEDRAAPAAGTAPVQGGALQTSGRRFAWVGLAAAAAVLLVAFLGLRPFQTDVPAQVLDIHTAYRSGQLDLAIRTSDAASVEAFVVDAGIGYVSRVFDLAMMGYQLEGGALATVDDGPATLAAYRGSNGDVLICAMYQGETAALPAPDSRVRVSNVDFLVYHRDGVTLVFWQEQGLVCVLTGEGDPQAVIDLAAAKARG